MKLLVANLGSTSFKYSLFRVEDGTLARLTKGGYERVENFAAVIQDALDTMVADGALTSLDDLDGVGFKTVLGKDVSGCVLADDHVIDALEALAPIAPAHNPAYANGIRQFRSLVDVPLVALFETSFYQWMPEPAKRYAVPESWFAAGVRRYGFHGASHKFIAEKSAEVLGRPDVVERVRNLYLKGPGQAPEKPLRVVSCHLGGSSSVTGIDSGIAIGTSMGMSPQGGPPQNNRVGDLDSMAFPFVKEVLGLREDEVLEVLTKESGLLGLSGVSNDIRDIYEAAEKGNASAVNAIDCLAHSIRQYIGSFAFQMGGLEALAPTGLPIPRILWNPTRSRKESQSGPAGSRHFDRRFQSPPSCSTDRRGSRRRGRIFSSHPISFPFKLNHQRRINRP